MSLFLSEGLRPSDSPTRSLARRFAGALRSRGSFAIARSLGLAFAVGACVVPAAIGQPPAQPKYDLLLKGGHVIDPRNGITAVRDVAIADGKVAAETRPIGRPRGRQNVEVCGLGQRPSVARINAPHSVNDR